MSIGKQCFLKACDVCYLCDFRHKGDKMGKGFSVVSLGRHVEFLK